MDITRMSLDVQLLLSLVKIAGWELKEVRLDVDGVEVTLCKQYPSEVMVSVPSA